MDKVKIKIEILGGLKHPLDVKKIKKWKTSFFEISAINTLKALPDTTTDDDWSYSDKQLSSIIGDTSGSQVVVALINHELENNYYGRRISNNCYVLSLYETADIVLESDLHLEDFVIQNLYYVAALYYKFKGKIPTSETKLTHQDIRGCLFDLNANKDDLVFSLGKVSICDKCKAEFDSTMVPENFVENIKNELNRIKKSKYFLIRDFIQRRPGLSFIIGAIISITLSILANFISSKLTVINNSNKPKTEITTDTTTIINHN